MHYGWIVVAACLLIGICGYGTYYCFTLFYTHLVTEFGWSRSAISGVMSLGLIAYGLFALPHGNGALIASGRGGPLLSAVFCSAPGWRWRALSLNFGNSTRYTAV